MINWAALTPILTSVFSFSEWVKCVSVCHELNPVSCGCTQNVSTHLLVEALSLFFCCKTIRKTWKLHSNTCGSIQWAKYVFILWFFKVAICFALITDLHTLPIFTVGFLRQSSCIEELLHMLLFIHFTIQLILSHLDWA